jgi:hypothetical protein
MIMDVRCGSGPFREQARSHSGFVSDTYSAYTDDQMWERACSRMAAPLFQHLAQ